MRRNSGRRTRSGRPRSPAPIGRRRAPTSTSPTCACRRRGAGSARRGRCARGPRCTDEQAERLLDAVLRRDVAAWMPSSGCQLRTRPAEVVGVVLAQVRAEARIMAINCGRWICGGICPSIRYGRRRASRRCGAPSPWCRSGRRRTAERACLLSRALGECLEQPARLLETLGDAALLLVADLERDPWSALMACAQHCS